MDVTGLLFFIFLVLTPSFIASESNKYSVFPVAYSTKHQNTNVPKLLWHDVMVSHQVSSIQEDSLPWKTMPRDIGHTKQQDMWFSSACTTEIFILTSSSHYCINIQETQDNFIPPSCF